MENWHLFVWTRGDLGIFYFLYIFPADFFLRLVICAVAMAVLVMCLPCKSTYPRPLAEKHLYVVELVCIEWKHCVDRRHCERRPNTGSKYLAISSDVNVPFSRLTFTEAADPMAFAKLFLSFRAYRQWGCDKRGLPLVVFWVGLLRRTLVPSIPLRASLETYDLHGTHPNETNVVNAIYHLM